MVPGLSFEFVCSLNKVASTLMKDAFVTSSSYTLQDSCKIGNEENKICCFAGSDCAEQISLPPPNPKITDAVNRLPARDTERSLASLGHEQVDKNRASKSDSIKSDVDGPHGRGPTRVDALGCASHIFKALKHSWHLRRKRIIGSSTFSFGAPSRPSSSSNHVTYDQQSHPLIDHPLCNAGHTRS